MVVSFDSGNITTRRVSEEPGYSPSLTLRVMKITVWRAVLHGVCLLLFHFLATEVNFDDAWLLSLLPTMLIGHRRFDAGSRE